MIAHSVTTTEGKGPRLQVDTWHRFGDSRPFQQFQPRFARFAPKPMIIKLIWQISNKYVDFRRK